MGLSLLNIILKSNIRIHKPKLPNIYFSKQQELKCVRFMSNCLQKTPIDTSKKYTTIKKEIININKVLLRYTHSQRNANNGKKPDDPRNEMMVKVTIGLLTGYMMLYILSLLLPNTSNPEDMRYISWNEFVHLMLAKGEVEEIIARPDLDIVTIKLHEGAIIKGRKVDQRTYHMNIADLERFEQKLREAEGKLGIKPGHGVPVVYDRSLNAPELIVFLFFAGILALIYFARPKGAKSPISLDMFSQIKRAKYTLVDPLIGQGKGVRFKDVAGLKEAKQEVMEFVDYLKKPERYQSLGAKVPKGALLLGPPGCGKTMLAKAVATESNVPFLSMNGSEFIEMIGGLGAARVRDLFKEGRKRSPCIIYIDEIDAIGRKRSSRGPEGGADEGEQTLNQLLVEMDGIGSKEGVLMLASTNRADILDKALLRPGRFDRHILIDLPTLEERKEIFEQHLKIKLDKEPKYYSRKMAHLTPGFSGADIANVCNEAALHAARSSQKVVLEADLDYAVERVVGGTEKRSHAISPDEKKIVAYHEAGHALVGWLLPTTDALLKVTIVPRTNAALGFAQYTPTERYLLSKQALFEKMCLGLGGRVAESIVFNSITTGAQNDLDKVTKIANSQVRQYGMNEQIGLLSFPEDTKNSVRPYSNKLAALMETEVSRLVANAYFKTEKLLKENYNKLELIAEELLRKESINYDEMVKLIGPPPNGEKRAIESYEFNIPIDTKTKDS
ncbi:ATPase, AAA-type, core,Peptidase, FtsH,Peptidase M41, FtsH extracellular,Peptidase M41,P-loop containing [Cinara cedri]|uniref:ATPase, AAA-type, core,Peptidase, FtsH,Peptidase M41, FtsH extracellular,Peptidase M41,P-loop containing n=1 Tax=Cinara cedri TaxID=506608 RepID=A0A5E4MF55_9HEMI|nr:ATPase, AAA-type, core,Peptidase, FtsH,Peptidase M41, FtsH extracellular,Peptidase M41,P-loop containing [Cinara cedri]